MIRLLAGAPGLAELVGSPSLFLLQVIFMTDLTPHSLLTRNPDLVAAGMNGDIVMMSIERGLYFGISGVGTRIWELLEQPTRVEALAQAIQAEYDVDEATCQQDLLVFARELIKHGVVTVATAG